MWWKFYLWFITVITILGIPSFFVNKGKNIFALAVDTTSILLLAFGVYSYIYKKNIVSKNFWRNLFWITNLYVILGAIYTLTPTSPIIKYLSIFEESNNTVSFISYTFISMLLIPGMFALYKLSKGKSYNARRKSNKSTNLSPKMRIGIIYSLNAFFILFLEISLLLVVGLIVNISHLDMNNIVGNSFIIMYIFIAVSIPFSIYLFGLYKTSIKNNLMLLTSSIFLLFLVLGITVMLAGVTNKQPQLVDEQQTNNALSELTNEELLKAVNAKRKDNAVASLSYDAATCEIAKTRVDEIAKYGIEAFNSTAAFQRAIDNAFEGSNKFNPYKSPTSFYEFATYEATVTNALTFWEKHNTKVLFTRKDFVYGCVDVKDGYGVLIVGTEYPNPSGNSDSPFKYSNTPVSSL